MDKYEYQLKTEHIRQVAARKEYSEAAKLCATIDWTKIRDVKMLTFVSNIFAEVGQYEDAIDVLQMAYQYTSMGRRIVYRLTELALKADSYEDAKNYFEEFCRIAPNDQGRYILLYKMARSQKATLEEKIIILEAYKREDFDEKWAYELAVLYAMNNQKTQCVQLCDDIILWFGLGKYVDKALKLKAQFAPLTAAQKEKARQIAKKQQEEKEQEEIAISRTDLEEEEHSEFAPAEQAAEAAEAANAAKVAAAAETQRINAGIQKSKEAPAEKVRPQIKETDARSAAEAKAAAEVKAAAKSAEAKAAVEAILTASAGGDTEVKPADAAKFAAEAKPTVEAKPAEKKYSSVVTSDLKTILDVINKSIRQDAGLEDESELMMELPQEPAYEEREAGTAENVEAAEASEAEVSEEPKEAEVTYEENPAEEGKAAEEPEEAEVIYEENPAEEGKAAEEPEEAEVTCEENIAEEAEASEEAEEAEVTCEENIAEEAEASEEPEEAEVTYEADAAEETEADAEAYDQEPEEEALYEEDPEEIDAADLDNALRRRDSMPPVNPENMSEVWHFAIQVPPNEDAIEMALDYLEDLAAGASRPVPKSVVKITGRKLNQKGLVHSLDRLFGKTILVEGAGDMNSRVIGEFCKILDPSDRSLLVVFIDTPAALKRLFANYTDFAEIVTAQFIQENYSAGELMEHAKKYADSEDSVLDQSGELALMEQLKIIAANREHDKKRIVEIIINNAIEKAEKKSVRKLFQMKYNKEGCLILRAKDFEAEGK